jgi:hypothetical protein
LQWPAIDINPSVVVGIEVASLELASLQREVLETEEPF